MELEKVIPWGRSFKEYREMFSLSDADIEKTILGCGDGPASFNAELTESSGRIVSVDPVYQFNANEIRARIDDVYPKVILQMINNKGSYVWETISSVEELGNIRMEAMNKFLGDYESGKRTGRYLNESLPILPFSDNSFELALCSHFLFLYSEHVSQDHHISSMMELCRVSKEVRVYPLLSLDGETSRHLMPVMSSLRSSGIEVSLEHVSYQFQKGANQMLVAKCV